MNATRQLLAAGSLLLASACSDAMTAPAGDDDFEGARSASKTATSVRLRTEQVNPDGSVTYSLRVRSNSTTLSSVQGAVLLTPGMFTLLGQTVTAVPGGVAMINTAELMSGRIRFAAYSQTRISGAGDGTELFRFTVRQLHSGPAISTVLDVTGYAPHLVGSAGAGTIASQSCGSIALWGDGNDDGNVNITDAQQLARHSVGLTVASLSAVITRGDVTADGSVNISDAQQIARFSVGLSAVPRAGAGMC